MATNLIAAITIDREYSILPVNDAYLNNLLNSSSNADVYNKLSNSGQWFLNYNVFSDNIVTTFHPLNLDIDFRSGQNFRVEFDITNDQSINVGIGYFSDGAFAFGYPLPFSFPGLNPPPLNLASGTHHVSVDANSGLISFDEIRIYYFLNTTNNTSATISNLTVNELDSDPFGEFDIGDRIIVKWDDVTNNYLVQLENNPGGILSVITSGPQLGRVERDQVTGVLFSRGPTGDKLEQLYGARSEYKFCDELDLVEFFFSLDTYSFPYFTSFTTQNSPSCTIDNIVCDIELTQDPIVIPATNRYSNDGQVFISATSSHADFGNPIKYSTNPPIEIQHQYSNLPNSSSLFINQSYGLHTYYAIDKYNCYRAVQVSVPAIPGSEYAPKYRLQYNDIQKGVQSVITILERAYEGSVQDVCGTDDPFVLSKTSGDINNKFDTLKPTFCSFNLITNRSFQFIGLISQDDRKYLIDYSHGDTTWKGFLTPSLGQEPYSPNKIYPVSITATDGLGNLNDYDFLDDSGNVLTGNRSLLSIISLILKKLDLRLNIVSALNKYASGMYTGLGGDDPLPQTFINTDAFIDDSGLPFKCDVVLTNILQSFGAFIQQNDSKWWIIETDSQTQDYTYREYDYTGAYLSNGTITKPDKNIVSPTGVDLTDAVLANVDHTLDFIPAYGTITINHNLNPVRSIFPVSMDKWTANYLSTTATTSLFPVEDSTDKGISFNNLGSTRTAISSPLFRVKTRADSLNIKFDYKVTLLGPVLYTDPITGITYNLNNVDPPYVKMRWRLRLFVGSATLYYSERVGWTLNDKTTTSSSSIGLGSGTGSRSLTVSTGLTISVGQLIKLEYTVDRTKWIRGNVTSYNPIDGVLIFEAYSKSGTGTFNSWDVFINGPEYIDNYIFIDDYGNDFKSFSKDVNLPNFNTLTEVQLQLQLLPEGSTYIDFNNESELKAISTAVNNIDYKVRGKDPVQPEFYLIWYKLRNGEDAEDSPEIIRGNDYNSVGNTTVWEQIREGFEFYRYVKDIQSFSFQTPIVTFLPNRAKAIELETLTFTNNANYKENLSVDINSGDLPVSIVNDEIYTNIFRYADGSPTRNWSRKLISESITVQSILLKNFGNQYNKPTWRLTGSFLIPDAKFTSIVKQLIPSIDITIINQEFISTLNPWTNFGTGISWTNPDGLIARAEQVGLGGDNNSQSLRQQVSDLFAGMRLRIDFKLTRADQSGSRTDRLVAIFYSNNTETQKVVLYDGIQSDGNMIRGVLFNLDQDATHIGFRIENIVSGGVTNYSMDYFRVKGISVIRYYYFNGYSRSDRNNMYSAELVQLIPMISSTDTDIDDSGGGDTGGGEDGNGGGNNGGNPFGNGAFSSGWGGGFDTVLI